MTNSNSHHNHINKIIKITLVIALFSMLYPACTQRQGRVDLPIMGRKQVVERNVNGEAYYDTVDHTIADFSFYDQDSTLITNQSFRGMVYVSDFFFTSCPTICPKMKKQMLRVYSKFENESRVKILSHTIDPDYDNVQVLHQYAEALGVKSAKWHFVTGNQDSIYHIGEKSYMVTAGEDGNAPGGYIHSGAFLLIDDKRKVRGVYNGIEEKQVTLLLADIDILIQELGNANE